MSTPRRNIDRRLDNDSSDDSSVGETCVLRATILLVQEAPSTTVSSKRHVQRALLYSSSEDEEKSGGSTKLHTVVCRVIAGLF